MNAHYELLGLEGAELSALSPLGRQDRFRQQLHDIAAGTAELSLTPQSVHVAAEIAALDPSLDKEQRIVLILLIVVLLAALQEGSTRFPVTGAESVEPMRRMLGPLCGSSFGQDAVEKMRRAIELLLSSDSAAAIVGFSPTEYKPLLYLEPYLYQHRSFSAEVGFARRFASLMNTQPEPPLSESYTLVGSDHLSTEQKAAVERAITRPITIISGGPGTGKTSIIIEIVRALVATGIDASRIMLAAPTGKAAYRIGEAIRQVLANNADTDARLKDCPAPSTLHRLLGYSPTMRRFRYHRNNPLVADAIIIDEASMLDLELMSRLLDALQSGTRLVLLGDADQLPSVSAGAVFRDLIPSVGESVAALLTSSGARLTRSYRTKSTDADGAAIFKLANAIKAGNLTLSSDTEPESIARRDAAEAVQFRGVEWYDGDLVAFLEHWYGKYIGRHDEPLNIEKRAFDSIDTGFAPMECESIREIFLKLSNSRILSVTRVLQSGSIRVNEVLHRRKAREVGVSAEFERFIAGEPVMVVRNDYERMLFNGDQGVVLWVRRPGAELVRMAVFPRADNFVAFNLDALKDQLELSYAMTVHKAQGSEFDAVALILPEKDLPILSRELLYTAVSRARHSVTMVGSKEVLESGISRKIERYSGVREQLAECLTEGLRA